MTRPLNVGLVLWVNEDVPTGEPKSWAEIRAQALAAEGVGFDTVWVPDELLWEVDAWPGPRGFWEGVAMTAAVAAATSEIRVGTWVLSALHRHPALTAKVASTLDEISGGRFLFGFGAGHAGRQGAAFGYPPDKVVSRYEEALQIVVPLLREGAVEFEGEYHRAALSNRPPSPRAENMPIMLAGHGPRTIRLAVEHGDIWSGYATKGSQPGAFADLLAEVDRACEEVGRDPATLGKSIGVEVVPQGFEVAESLGVEDPLTGTPDDFAAAVEHFAAMGVTSLELVVRPETRAALAVVYEYVDALDG